MRSIERMLEPSANAPITAICLSVLSTFAMPLTVLHKYEYVKYFCDTIMPWYSPLQFLLWLSPFSQFRVHKKKGLLKAAVLRMQPHPNTPINPKNDPIHLVRRLSAKYPPSAASPAQITMQTMQTYSGI